MKKPITNTISNYSNHVAFVLTIFLVFAVITTPVSAHTGHEQTSHVAQYTVDHTNETATNSWIVEYPEAHTYQIAEGSPIEVEIDDLTNPATPINITIGNLTVTNATDEDAQGNLVLGYYQLPGDFGFVANTSWEDVTTDLAQYNFPTFDVDLNASYQFGVTTFDTVNITFADGFQQTHLVYNKASGILYYANTTAGNFNLEFSIDGFIPYEEPLSSDDNDAYFSLIFPLLSLIFVYKFSKKQ